MKKLLVIILFVSVLPICSQTDGSGISGGAPEIFKNQKWFPHLVSELKKCDKIDASAAHFSRLVSSDMKISGESDDQTISRFGKITEDDIKMICTHAGDSENIVVITSTRQFHFLFSYNTETGKLKRSITRSPIVILHTENLQVVSADADKISFKTNTEEPPAWRKHFEYNKKTEKFLHVKNCITIQGNEQCEMLTN